MAVGNHINSPIAAVSQHRFSQGHLFYSAKKARCFNHISQVELIFDQNQHAVNDVMHNGLCTEANRQACNARRSEQRRNIDAENLQRMDDGDEGHHPDSRCFHHACQCHQLGGPRGFDNHVLLGQPVKMAGCKMDDAVQNIGDDQDHDKLGKFVVYQHDQIVGPRIRHTVDHAFMRNVDRQRDVRGKHAKQFEHREVSRWYLSKARGRTVSSGLFQ